MKNIFRKLFKITPDTVDKETRIKLNELEKAFSDGFQRLNEIKSMKLGKGAREKHIAEVSDNLRAARKVFLDWRSSR